MGLAGLARAGMAWPQLKKRHRRAIVGLRRYPTGAGTRSWRDGGRCRTVGDEPSAHADSIFDFARALLKVKSPTEFFKLSSAHLSKQFQAVTEQTKELSTLAQKVASETAEPIKTGITSAFKKVA